MLQSLIRFPLGPLARLVRPMIRCIRDRTQRVEGLPPGLAFETLDALCREHGRGGLERCRYVQLSTWKAHGTYRVELLAEAGARWRLIFKDEYYWPEFIPALEGLPVSPGPPEATIYHTQSPFLSPFLPHLFWFREIEPGRHFQYLLEDLTGRHKVLPPGTRQRHANAARGLVHMQRALRRTFPGKHHDGLILYDRQYSERLLDYARSNLSEYQVRTGDSAVATLLDRWPNVASVHQRDEFYDNDLRVPIHGDFTISNILAHRDNETQLKVVDWEWAGIGLPHADLARLSRSVNGRDRLTLLHAFVEGDRRHDAEQHRRLFHWCMLEHRLLNVAFQIKNSLAPARRLHCPSSRISGLAREVLIEVDLLRATQAQGRGVVGWQ